MDLGLKGKVAFVAAASKGMGKACALGLAGEGVRVVMCARGEAALKEAATEVERKTAPRCSRCLPTSEGGGLVRARWPAHDAWGGIDVLVANVGRSAARPSRR
jgi:3-oxoacyl-[acyl-carrier protein] reductase